jgi:hypothetical protein
MFGILVIHRDFTKTYSCWICLEISITRSRKILKNLSAARGARRGLVWHVDSVDWRRARARDGLEFFVENIFFLRIL